MAACYVGALRSQLGIGHAGGLPCAVAGLDPASNAGSGVGSAASMNDGVTMNDRRSAQVCNFRSI